MATLVEHPDRQPPENWDPTGLSTPARFAVRGAVRTLVDEALAADVLPPKRPGLLNPHVPGVGVRIVSGGPR
jgi:hypothetical protein